MDATQPSGDQGQDGEAPRPPDRGLAWRTARSLYWSARRLWESYKPVLDLGGGVHRTVLLAGTPRSGTTWAGNVLAEMSGARSLFEPFLLNRRREFALLASRFLSEPDLLRNYQLYIPPGEGRQSPYFGAVDRILCGRVTGRWCHSTTPPGIYVRRVVKDVRLNLMLRWLAETWPELRIVWLVRNPIPTVESLVSKAKQGWRMTWTPDCVLDQPRARADWLEPYVEAMTRASELWERLAHKWCIETLIPLRQRVTECPNVVMARYEDLRKGWEAWQPVMRLVSPAGWKRDRFEAAFPAVSHVADQEVKERGLGARQSVLGAEAHAGIERIVEAYGLTSFLRAEPARESRD